jgi:TolB-like protein/Tfp pilus assembly protein PilF
LADIFISYSRIDQPVIKKLSKELEARDFEVWWDRELLAGDTYADDIERELNCAKAVIVAWSASGSKSRWVRDEAAVAADTGRLIAISIDGSIPPIGFRQFHFLDFSAWQGEQNAPELDEVFKAIAGKFKRTSYDAPESLNYTQSKPYQKHFQAPEQHQKPGKNDEKIVAVLPFANRSPLSEDAFFADGVHDELITQISKLVAIQVISRTSVMGYRDVSKSIPEIANELGAVVILEGAVQRSGKRVRINVQLIDGQTDTNIWSDKYDRELSPENIFDIQSEITRVIADALDSVLSDKDESMLSSKAPTNNLIAYDAYLRGKQKARSEATGEDAFHAAIAEFEHAILVDPAFAEAHANKARAYMALYWFFGWDSQWLSLASLSVQEAVALSPNSIETLLAQAYFHYWGELDLKSASAVLERVLSISPQNTEAWACKSYVSRRDGHFLASIVELKNAMHLDPMLVDLPMELTNTFAAVGDFEQAHEQFKRVLTLSPKANYTAIMGADLYFAMGDQKRAYESSKIEVEVYDFAYYYRRAYHALNTTNKEHIDNSLHTWPEAFYGIPMFPEAYNLYKAQAYQLRGDFVEANKILLDVKSRIDRASDPYPAGWIGEAAYYPVTLPGLMKDLQGVKEAVKDFESKAKRDEWGALYHYHEIACAFTRCGDVESALEYLEKLMLSFGPASYLPMSIIPFYKDLHQTRKYKSFKIAYKSWQLSTVNKQSLHSIMPPK